MCFTHTKIYLCQTNTIKCNSTINKGLMKKNLIFTIHFNTLLINKNKYLFESIFALYKCVFAYVAQQILPLNILHSNIHTIVCEHTYVYVYACMYKHTYMYIYFFF